MATCRNMIELGRRQFLKRGGVGVTGAAVATVAAQPAKRTHAAARVDYPANRLANVADLALNEALDVAYPDNDAPGVLIKLGHSVDGGVGPDGDIVGFSTICPHKGYPLFYNAEGQTLNCPGHYSIFDCEAGGQQTWGHATQNLPQYTLRVDENGDIHAEGLDELLYGRLSNVL